MVILNKIYTRTGDDGTTALGSGERVPKASLRVETYGTVDETNATIGLAASLLMAQPGPHGAGQPASAAAMATRLARIQNDLFDLGADLCVPQRPDETADAAKRTASALRITEQQVDRLEAEIDELNADLQPLRSFVLPGGATAAAQLHVARTVCRRAERLMVALAAAPGEIVNPAALRYVNRLSDFLFVASRHLNDHGRSDVLWVPGGNR